MGCGSSTAVSSAAGRPIQVQPKGSAAGKSATAASGAEAKPASTNGFAVVAQQKKLPPIKSDQKPQNETSTAAEDEKTGKGGVAFSVAMGTTSGGESTAGQPAGGAEIDKILRKPLPPRLRHLEPLENAPSISPEQLAEKLRKAEEKRERMLEKRRNSSVTKQSKARRQLLKAQEYSQQELAGEAGGAAEATNPEAERLQQKQAVAEQKRLAQLAAVQERQRQREERAKAARERARRQKEEEQMEAELNIEKDEGGGDSDSDASWLGEGQTAGGSLRGPMAAGSSETGAGDQRLLSAGDEQPPHRDSSGYGSSRGGDGGNSSLGGSRATTGKTVSTVMEDDSRDNDFYD